MRTILLRGIHQELISVLMPELQSDRARTTAAMVEFLLRHLISREEHLTGTRQNYLDREHELANEIAGQAAASGNSAVFHQDEVDSDLAALIEQATTAVFMERSNIGSSDRMVLSAMIKEEVDYVRFDALETGDPNPEAASEEPATMSVTPERLNTYLQSRFPDKGSKVVAVEPVLGGASKDVFVVECDKHGQREHIVIRRDRPNGPFDTSSSEEYILTSALYRQGFLVPEPLWVEEDRKILGYPFQVTRKVAGRPLTRSFTLAANEESLNACRWMAEFLARLHKLDITQLPLPKEDRPTADYIREYIADWERIWKSKRRETSVILTATFKWLLNNIPEDGQRPVLVHGDAGFHNLLVDGGQATAMLDWECAHIGHPGEDLSYCRLWVENVMNWDDFLKHYKDNGGEAEDHSRFFSTMYLARNAVTSAVSSAEISRGVQWDIRAAFSGIYWHRYYLQKLAEEISPINNKVKKQKQVDFTASHDDV